MRTLCEAIKWAFHNHSHAQKVAVKVQIENNMGKAAASSRNLVMIRNKRECSTNGQAEGNHVVLQQCFSAATEMCL